MDIKFDRVGEKIFETHLGYWHDQLQRIKGLPKLAVEKIWNSDVEIGKPRRTFVKTNDISIF